MPNSRPSVLGRMLFCAKPLLPVLRSVRSLSTARGSLSGLKINADRLQETLHHTCQWGAAHRYGRESTETGMARLALSDDDARVRRWFADEVADLGCALSVDEMGNMFAKRKGALQSPAPMTAMGSHLDTQPRGGRYDGILGILAAVEVMRTMKDNGFQTQFDVGIVNWTNEEGARFPKSMMASGVWAGEIPREKAWNLADIFDPSVTVKAELERHDYIGALACSSDAPTGFPLGAHFELHIEQGPILEESGKKIGVVQGAQAYRRDAHTGTTPLTSRKDPLLAASKMIASSNAIAKKLGALASTGVIKIPRGRDSGWLPLTSGAGHDSVYTSKRCQTTMIFVPCKDGVSHHPEEYCSPEDCANGAQTLLEAVLGYDQLRASRC
ncbi:Zn-dependent exopeptidase [Colletotrichum sublineola]|nr:Zn-dependent exopeptidase [Colletotrichum sublineola]